MHVEVISFVMNTWKLLSMTDKSNTLRSAGNAFVVILRLLREYQAEADKNVFK